MKLYEKSAHITTPLDKSVQFHDLVVQRIDEYQRVEGLEVEIQYQHTLQSFSALVLGYRIK